MTTITVETPILESPRVAQVRGIFDLTSEKTSRVSWNVDLPLDQQPWHIGLIVGPSGCGKSTLVRHLFGSTENAHVWPHERSILDAFPADLPIKTVVELLSSVGFSSPPAWLRPFHVLSTGQQFRVTLARLLAETWATAAPADTRRQPIVFDEFTSVVDRTVAQIGSAALAKTVRRLGLRFIAVTCHEDVEDWLDPDWVYRPAEGTFARRRLRRRPEIDLDVVRCRPSAWPLFAPHHYLSSALARSAVCFLALWRQRPVAFSAWLPFVGKGAPARREHRTVTLPDYQGVGIGNALSAGIASMWTALRYRAVSTTTHPAMIRARLQSPLWHMHRPPSLLSNLEQRLKRLRHASTRLTAGFTYIGPAMNRRLAQALLRSRAIPADAASPS